MTTSNQALRQEERYVRKAAIVIALAFVSIVSHSTPLLAANPVPIINQPLVPGSAAPGGAAFTLTVNGTGFVSGSTVHWNGSPRTTTFVSGSQFRASPPTEILLRRTRAGRAWRQARAARLRSPLRRLPSGRDQLWPRSPITPWAARTRLPFQGQELTSALRPRKDPKPRPR
jgi:hypothetical protein